MRDGDLCAYREAGITRLSIGVQSFERNEIQTLGRKHTAEQIERVVESARASELQSVSLDLMFAVPGQTPASWQHSLRCAIALDVDHISAYGLTVEEGTPYAAWRAREPGAFFDDAREAELYAIAIETLRGRGLRAVRDQQLRAARASLRAQRQLLGERRVRRTRRRRRIVSRRRARGAYAFAGRVRRGGARRPGRFRRKPSAWKVGSAPARR